MRSIQIEPEEDHHGMGNEGGIQGTLIYPIFWSLQLNVRMRL